MKKLLAVAVLSFLLVFVVSSAFAAPKSTTGEARQNTGCGLGTMLFKNSADDSAMLQAFQAFLNFFPPLSLVPTIGITAGTAECQKPKKFASNDQINEFVVANMDNLAKDIARGHGETLDAFADLMEVPAEKRTEFYQRLQANFSNIFPSENVVLANVLDNVADVYSTK